MAGERNWTMTGTTRVLTMAALILVFSPRQVSAQNADDLAKQTQNPVASLISVPLQANFDVGLGAREATSMTFNIQPVAPFALNKTWNAILRVITPVLSHPTDDGSRITGMGDTTLTFFLAPARATKLIWGVGPVLFLPTGTNNTLGTEKVGIGPSIVALAQPGKWTTGLLWNQIWS